MWEVVSELVIEIFGLIVIYIILYFFKIYVKFYICLGVKIDRKNIMMLYEFLVLRFG